MRRMSFLIYVVEDDLNIQEIESFALKNSGYEVEAFDQAKTFFKRMEEKKADLVLLDIMLPDADGISIMKKLRSNGETKNLPVIMVTAKTSEIDKVKGLDSGADDYITKPFGVMELISRVKALLRRSYHAPEDVELCYHEIELNMLKRQCKVNGEIVELTYKEFELLHILIQNAGIVLKRDVLMERVWETDFEGESRTLDMHIKTLRQKLGEGSRYIKTVRNVGYCLE